MNIFRKRKQDEVEKETPQPANDEPTQLKAPVPINRQPRSAQRAVEKLTAEQRQKLGDEIMQEHANDETEDTKIEKRQSTETRGDRLKSIHSQYSFREKKEEEDPRKYKAYDMVTTPKWIDIQFANGRRVLLSHYDIKRVDSMTPDALSIFCSDCIIKLEGKNLHDLIQPFEKIHRLHAFNDKKFDTPEDGQAVINLIELVEIRGISKGNS